MDFNSGTSHKSRHLCVLVHGLWGNPNHLEVMAQCLREKHPQETLHILVAKRNSGSFTYDGIELGGERVCQEIEEEIEKLARAGQEIKRLSMVGYSLGGLVSRYAIGLLYSKGLFDKITPVNFTSFASPHLGVRTPLIGWHNHLWNVLGARTLSASGRQLFGTDDFRNLGKPLLEVLGDPESIFIKGLARFERRTLYANIVHDRSAVYYTTMISKNDPFTHLDKVKVTYLKGYEDIILDPATPAVLKQPDVLDLTFYGPFVKWFNDFIRRLPIVITLAIAIPLGTVVYLINSGYQSLKSSRRIRLHENGLAGIQPGNYRVPLLIKGVQEAVDDVYESLNSAQDNEYLAVNAEGVETNGSTSAQNDISQPAGEEPSMLSHRESEKSRSLHNHVFPTLALAPYQFRVIEALDNLGWRKYQVHIQKVMHSHAAIIFRIQKPRYSEGYHVFRHWLDEEFII